MTRKEQRPELRWIAVEKLFVDRDNYQRDLKKTTLKKLREGWDWNACGVLVVAPRGNGRFAIADGSHRYTVALEGGIHELPCSIVNTHSIGDEADAFCKINRNRADTSAYDYLRGLAACGDVDALEISKIVERHGFRLSNYGGLDNITAAGALMNVFDDYGPAALDKALYILRNAWAGDPKSTRGLFIIGLARWVYYAEPVPPMIADLISKLNKKKVSEIIRLMPEWTSSKGHGATIAFNTIYNERRTRNRIDNAIFDRSEANRRGAASRRSKRAVR